jgi:hypothetical protein
MLMFSFFYCCFLLLAYFPSLADSLESSFDRPPTPPKAAQTQHDSELRWNVPGIDHPYTLPAAKAPLEGDAPVIGVIASGKARAYLVEAFERGPMSHIVNDIFNGVPISITHCDISHCTRVFTSESRGKALDLRMGGILHRRMVLRWNNVLYRQEDSEPLSEGDSPLPLEEYPAEITTFSAWRKAHPESDVYMGGIQQATPPEAGGPRLDAPRQLAFPPHQPH